MQTFEKIAPNFFIQAIGNNDRQKGIHTVQKKIKYGSIFEIGKRR